MWILIASLSLVSLPEINTLASAGQDLQRSDLALVAPSPFERQHNYDIESALSRIACPRQSTTFETLSPAFEELIKDRGAVSLEVLQNPIFISEQELRNALGQ